MAIRACERSLRSVPLVPSLRRPGSRGARGGQIGKRSSDELATVRCPLGTGVIGMKEFPPFRLDTVNQCLWRRRDTADDERVLLTPKAFAVLRYLVEHT